MTGPVHLWLRHESRATERRTPITPSDAKRLLSCGYRLTVEESPQRVFNIGEYTTIGCSAAPTGSWPDAPCDAVIVGLKELPREPDRLSHRHLFFGHAFKGQHEAQALLERFCMGGGQLLDMEYLVGPTGRRLAAFGYWAGYMGAALAVLHNRGRLKTPLSTSSREAIEALLVPRPGDPTTRALVVGAAGRAGRGATDALTAAGIIPRCWDSGETKTVDRSVTLDQDLLVNCIHTNKPNPPFVTPSDVTDPKRRLSVISDVTCDVTSDLNLLPIYNAVTTWEQPVLRLAQQPPLDIISIDNLPSLVPREASLSFSAELCPVLLELADDGPPWQRARQQFFHHSQSYGLA